MTCGEKGSVESGAGIWRSKSGWRGLVGLKKEDALGPRPRAHSEFGTARAAVAPPTPLSPASSSADSAQLGSLGRPPSHLRISVNIETHDWISFIPQTPWHEEQRASDARNDKDGTLTRA
jgi:hypothetical protein